MAGISKCNTVLVSCLLVVFFSSISWAVEIRSRHSINRGSTPPDDDRFSLENLARASEAVLAGRGGGGRGGRGRAARRRTANPFARRLRCNRQAVFRTIDGTCNNLRRPFLGAAKTPLMRLVPENAYEDGISTPTATLFSSQDPLPLARTVSLAVHDITSNFSSRHSHLLMNFGQFTDHDITLSPEASEDEDLKEECCELDESEFVNEFSECFPVRIPRSDILVTECVPLLRSAPTPGFPGAPAIRFQLNDLTSFIDASQIYGSTNRVARSLRTFRGGKLKSSRVQGEETLPLDPENPEDCFSQVEECQFIAGDIRNSEQAGLTSVHTLFLREHNRIADEIRRVNRRFNDEQIYQTTRRILGAVLQRITYNEFLPEVLGPQLMRSFGLNLLRRGRFRKYNPRLDPSGLTEFSTAAFRFGHSLIRQTFTVSRNRQLDLSDIFAAFITVDEFGTNGILIGEIEDRAEFLERFITTGVRDNVYAEENDLPALNIQRGRDHGIVSYNDVRRFFNLPIFNSFDDLVGNTHTQDAANALQRAYPTVEDVEMFPGGLSELPVKDGIIGETFGHIIASQFRRLKFGDRFWFETNDKRIRFSNRQLAEIRKASLASVFCENVPRVPVREFLLVNELPENPRVACSSIRSMNFAAFRGRK